eukprot:TRINITY_DN3009_c0_g1_i7.p1 TRINITY_DN3009_c0_g1~~TRINITY_DN3009_c0_g1_i7.p1  ORF type:complete len:556 (+),score=99.54 TRINITY_DN3009_c0_g1_i7:490-2157(+)
MADYPKGFNFKGEQVVLVICSTSGDGVPPAYARPFCEWLRDGADGGSGIEDTYFSVLALGDRSYNHFCKCGKDVENYLEKIGSKCFADRVDVDCEDWEAIRNWMSKVLSGLNELPLVRQETDSTNENNIQEMSGWNKKNPFFAKVEKVEGLCKIENQKDDKNTIRVQIDLGDSELTYVAGDALGIYALNAPSQVNELLTALNLTGAEKVHFPKWNFNKVNLVEENGKISIKEAFLRCFDLRQPKPEILDQLTEKIPELKQKEFSKQFLEERHLIDIVKQCNKINLDTLITKYLRPLQPRLYSISSSPLEEQNKVQITVAEVKYESLGVDRVGVASTYLSERIQQKTTQIPVYITANPEFRLPLDITTPIIMVGPGTGLAPFRAFIIQRMYESKQEKKQCGTMVLYFGCRRHDQDYLYGDDLEKWGTEGVIKLYTAFSREDPGKKSFRSAQIERKREISVGIGRWIEGALLCLWRCCENGGGCGGCTFVDCVRIRWSKFGVGEGVFGGVKCVGAVLKGCMVLIITQFCFCCYYPVFVINKFFHQSTPFILHKTKND